jgi:CRISPR-associated protein Csb2
MTNDPDRVELWRWRITPPGPQLTMTLPAMETIRGAVAHVNYRRGHKELPASFHGGDRSGHGHAFWLPEDADGDGHIDHVLVFCANGMDAEIIASLASVSWFPLGDNEYRMAPSWMGPRPRGGLFGPATVWSALTPYVTPWRRLTKTGKERVRYTLDAQLLEEIRLRGLPTPSGVDWKPSAWCGDDPVLASQFASRGAKKDGPPSDAVASFPLVTFPSPVAGPLAFGFGAHFGLGLLVPHD